MKYFWEVLAVLYTIALLIVCISGYYRYQAGKIAVAMLAALLVSALMKIGRKRLFKSK